MDFIANEAEKLGYYLVDVATKGGKRLSIEIEIDKKDGISLDECGRFNRVISHWIEEKKIFPQGYTFDVSSPGLDKRLETDGHFLWATGKPVHIVTHEPVNGRHEIQGILSGYDVNSGVLTLELDGGRTIGLEKKKIARAKLYYKI